MYFCTLFGMRRLIAGSGASRAASHAGNGGWPGASVSEHEERQTENRMKALAALAAAMIATRLFGTKFHPLGGLALGDGGHRPARPPTTKQGRPNTTL
jgi:hypothetical protein